MAGIFWPASSNRPSSMERERAPSHEREKVKRSASMTSHGIDELCRAAHKGDLAAIARLVETRHVNVNGAQPARIPLIHATAKNQWKSVKALLDRDAKPNLMNSQGQMALHIAADRGYSECLSALLNGGADPKLPDKHGKTAHDIAKAKKRDDCCLVLETWPVVKRLSRRVAPLQERASAKSRDVEVMKQFLVEFNRRKAEIDKEVFGNDLNVPEGPTTAVSQTKSNTSISGRRSSTTPATAKAAK